MRTYFFLLIIFTLTISCAEHDMEDNLKNEYEKLAKENDKKIVINEIRVLDEKNVSFEKLGKSEISALEKINAAGKVVVKEIERLDALIKLSISQRQDYFSNVTADQQLEYTKKINADSMELRENQKQILLIKIEEMENIIKIQNINNLSNSPSVFNSENLIIQHRIDIKIEDEIIVDTLYFYSFNNGAFGYLSENIFLRN